MIRRHTLLAEHFHACPNNRSTFQRRRAPQGTSILGADAAVRAVRSDHLDAVGLAQVRIEGVAVVASVANQPRGERVEERGGEGGVDELPLCFKPLVSARPIMFKPGSCWPRSMSLR